MKVLKPTTIPFPSSGQFIRGSTATYIEDGVLKTAAINEPRWQDGVLLLEGEATNLCLQSQAINLSPWTGGTRTLAAEFWAGTVPFFKVAKASAAPSEGIRSGATAVAAGSTWTMTLALLADNKTTCTVGIFANVAEGAGGYWGAPAECTKEIISGPGVFSAYSAATGSLWNVDGLSGTEPTLVRITRTLAPTSAVTTFSCMVYPGRAASITIGDAVKVTRVQLEPGAAATSYIPTTTTTVTRAADVCVGNFSRASNARYIDDNGLQQSAAINEPRIQNGRLLIEPYAENLCPYSYNLNLWGLGDCSVVSAAEIWAGAYDFFTIAKTTSSTSEYKAITIDTVATGDELSLTLALLSGSASQCVVGLRTTNAPNWGETTVEVLSGPATISSWEPGVPQINDLSATTPSIIKISRKISYDPGSIWVIIYPGLPSSTTIGTSVKATRVQVERGNIATSFIPRVSTLASRAADVHSVGLVYTTVTDTRPLWSSATTYSVGQVIRYNNVAYESLQSTNLNKQPDANPTWWLSLGADNISAAFDGKVGSKTIATDKLRMIIYPGAVVDAVGYLETNAIVVNTSVVDANRNLAYSNSTGFTESNIENWYDYFFVSPLADPATQVVHQGIPSLDPGLFIAIEMINPGTVEVGSVLTGYSTTIGKTQYGLKAGIVDYSKKESDEFGNVSIVERPYSKRMQGDIYVSNFDLNKVQRFLYNIRATPVLWMASDNPELAEVSYVYGFYKDFSTTISYPDVSMCNLDIEGLI